jgi:hypothetical protein
MLVNMYNNNITTYNLIFVDYEKMYYIVHTPLVRYHYEEAIVLTGNLLLLGNHQLTIST